MIVTGNDYFGNVGFNMDIWIKCNKLEARYCVNNGMLRCVEPYKFTLHKPTKIRIQIEEIGKRIITISSDDEIEATELYSILLKVERLLQIFDGAFIPLEELVIYGSEDENSYKSLVSHLRVQRLRYFSSADFVTVKSDRIVNYEDALTESLFEKWQDLLEELGVINQMYLYATSDCGFTNDVKCAFLVELAESLTEIIGKENILLQKFQGEQGNLKICLRTIIINFGQILFEKEMHYGIEKILTCLVNTRVNIMHIKVNQRTPKFDGTEATLYSIKMSYLYRLVIMKRLNIDEELYIENLKKRMRYIDSWNGIQDKLFERLR